MKIKYFYPISNVAQIGFDGKTYIQDHFNNGHIVVDEIILCGIGREVAKKRVKAQREKVVKTRMLNVGICKDCLEKYKKLSGTDWSIWVKATDETTVKKGAV